MALKSVQHMTSTCLRTSKWMRKKLKTKTLDQDYKRKQPQVEQQRRHPFPPFDIHSPLLITIASCDSQVAEKGP